MRSLWVLVAALACLASATPARAERGFDRIVVDRVDLEPSPLHGLARLRVFVSAVALQRSGAVLDIAGERAWQLRIGSSERKLPYLGGAYGDADVETAIVLVIATSSELADALPVAKSALVAELVQKFPEASAPLIGVLGYGDATSDNGKLGDAAGAVGRIEALPVESSPSSPDLIDALETAIRVLRRVKTKPEGRPVRKLIILVSDGRNRDPDRDTITDLGARAGRAGIRIHSLAYVPASGSKGSLLNLGELSRKSSGTFRWVRLASAQAWGQQVANLLAEIQRQYVLTYFVPAEDVAGKQLSVATTIKDRELVSNRVRVPQPRCGREECAADAYCVSGTCVARGLEQGWGVLGWIAALGGGLVGLGALGAIAAVILGVLRRHRGAAPKPPTVAGAPHVPARPSGPVSAAIPAAGVIQPLGHPVGQPIGGVHSAGAPSAQHPAAHPQPSGGYPAATMPPVLYVLSGPRTGQRIPLHSGFLIGKAPGCHLVLDQDGFASSQHASITIDARGTCTLADLGSTNGTFVNGIRATQVVLSHGMAVRVGSTELRFLSQ